MQAMLKTSRTLFVVGSVSPLEVAYLCICAQLTARFQSDLHEETEIAAGDMASPRDCSRKTNNKHAVVPPYMTISVIVLGAWKGEPSRSHSR